MKKKLLCLVLSLVLLLGTTTVFANEATAEITVYVTVSKYGEIAEYADGEAVCQIPVTLTGKNEYIIDDALRVLHENYYPDGESGYASSEGKWGLGIDVLWGDTSYNFGYQVNCGSESVMGLDHIIENGDYIDAYIYENDEEFESYSYFDVSNEEIFLDEFIDIQLFYASGYDENWDPIYSHCEGATITIDGAECEIVTDSEGKATLSFDEEGTYIISAKKTKIVDDKTVTAIIAPACVVKAKMRPEFKIMHNIAESFAECDLSLDTGNLPWIVADMIVYEKLFPESENCLAESRKEEARNILIESYTEATAPGDLAKTIIALRALGYDAQKAYTKNFKVVNFVQKLTDLVDNQDEKVTNVYTLPYVIMALAQAEEYASGEQLSYLIDAVLSKKDVWMSVSDGTDAMTPMILALSPYCLENEVVNSAVEEAVGVLMGEQREDGLIDGFPSYEAASTGLALCALSAVEIDGAEVINGENSLIDGLLSTADDDLTIFPNAFATEQGFRGLLAWQLFRQNSERMYNFSTHPMEEANVSGAKLCPVVFKTYPESASVAIEGAQALKDKIFDLNEGTYTYTVSAGGYYSSTGEFTVTAEDVTSRSAKTIEISLSAKGGGGFSGGSIREEEKKEEDEQEKQDELPLSTPVETVFSDISADDWHHKAIQYVYDKKLFSGTGEQFEPENQMTRGMLVTVLHRLAAPQKTEEALSFTDVSSDDWYAEGVKWAKANKIVFGINETEFAPNADITREQLAVILQRYAVLIGKDAECEDEYLSQFADSEDISDYAREAMEYAVWMGIINGKGDKGLCPKEKATRAEVATMIMRFAEVIEK